MPKKLSVTDRQPLHAGHLRKAGHDVMSRVNQIALLPGAPALHSSHEVLGLLTQDMRALELQLETPEIAQIRDKLLELGASVVLALASIESGALHW